MFFALLEMVFVVLLLAFFFSQICIPMIFGEKMFPLFRKSRITLEDKIREERSKRVEAKMQEELQEMVHNRRKGDKQQ